MKPTWRDRIIAFTRLPAAHIAPHPLNFRRHPDRQSAAVRTTLRRLGQTDALIVRRRGKKYELLDGHLRRNLAPDATWPCLVLDLNDAEAREFLLAHDRTAAMAEEDTELLGKLLAQLDKETSDDLADIIGRLPGTPDEEPPLPPPSALQKKWKTKFGQLWTIGRHRLLCGDSLKPEHVARLMNGQKWDVAIIDPPFEMDALPHLTDPCIVFGQAKHIRLIPEKLFRFERVIDKVSGHRCATTHVRNRHAFVVQCGTKRVCPKTRDTCDSIVICEERPDHAHQKCARLLREHLELWTAPWKIAFDPFCGSGTTLIVCEHMGRSGRGIEIEPASIACVLERFSVLGHQPKLT